METLDLSFAEGFDAYTQPAYKMPWTPNCLGRSGIMLAHFVDVDLWYTGCYENLSSSCSTLLSNVRKTGREPNVIIAAIPMDKRQVNLYIKRISRVGDRNEFFDKYLIKHKDNPKFINGQFAKEPKTLAGLPKVAKQKYVIDDLVYSSMTKATVAHGMSKKTFEMRIASPHFPTWCLYDEELHSKLVHI